MKVDKKKVGNLLVTTQITKVPNLTKPIPFHNLARGLPGDFSLVREKFILLGTFIRI